MTTWSNRITCMTGLLLLLLVLIACGSEAEESDVEKWSINSHGEFTTYSVKLAQQALSFPIVVPEYLPSDLNPSPYILGRSKEFWSEDEQEVRMAYNNFPDDTLIGAVIVTERSYKIFPPNPSPENSVVYTNIAGTEVVQEATVMDAVAGDGWYMLDGVGFWWDSRGITLNVEVYGYPHEEALRIVESMIEQE